MGIRNCVIVAIGLIVVTTALEEPTNGGFREFGDYYHNFFREKHGLKPLALSNELNVLAQTHAQRLAQANALQSSENGYAENLWAHFGPLRSLRVDVRDAVSNWFTGNLAPGHVMSRVDKEVLLSENIRFLGIGADTNDNYTVVVANYA